MVKDGRRQAGKQTRPLGRVKHSASFPNPRILDQSTHSLAAILLASSNAYPWMDGNPGRHAGRLRCALFRLHPAPSWLSPPSSSSSDFGPLQAMRSSHCCARYCSLFVLYALTRAFTGQHVVGCREFRVLLHQRPPSRNMKLALF
jgi:hypothetical protein